MAFSTLTRLITVIYLLNRAIKQHKHSSLCQPRDVGDVRVRNMDKLLLKVWNVRTDFVPMSTAVTDKPARCPAKKSDYHRAVTNIRP